MPRLRSLAVLAALVAIPLAARLIPSADALAVPPATPPAIELTGTLKTGIIAAGGETTGVQVSLDDKSVQELDLGGNKELLAAADELNGKRVYVKGTLATLKGVERPDRTVIKVTVLRKADVPATTPAQ